MRGQRTGGEVVWLMIAAALLVSQAAAQGQPDDQTRPRSDVSAAGQRPEQAVADGRSAHQPASGPSADKNDPQRRSKAASTHYFRDDFSSPTLERRNWEVAVGVAPTRDPLDRGQSVAAVRLSADKGAPLSPPELCSEVIGLAGVPGAELSYTVQHRGVEAGERLLVEYLAADGRWDTLERVVAESGDSIAFSRRMRVLPAEALHAGFRVRFRANVDDEDDAWYLGEVALVAYEPMHTLAVRVLPARNARVEVVPVGDSQRLDGTAPFTRSLPAGARVYLVAPPAVDGRVFSHWSVDGIPDVDRRRVLTLEMIGAVEVQAHYGPWVAGRSEASVTIAAVPEPGASIALGPDPGHLYADVITEAEHPCLTGEWLVLLAPSRTERLAFAGWVVNGEPLPGDVNPLEHQVTGDDVLLAEYVLLGDMNGDGELDKFDVDEFVLALVDPLAYADQYPDLDRMRRGDINGDGVFDALDVESFVDLLLND